MSIDPEAASLADRNDSYPKVLIVSGEPLHRQSATGITLCSLFSDWPTRRVAQIYTSGHPPESEFATNALRLSPRDLAPFCWWRAAGSLGAASTAANAVSGESKRDEALRRYVSPLLELLPYRIPLGHLARLREFQPDLIYSNLASIRIARLAGWLATTLRVPIVPHFMDDWLSTYAVPGRSIGTRAHELILNRQVRSIMRAAPLGLSIGQDMADEYSKRFAKPFHPFMNTVNVPDEPVPPRSSTRPVRFVFVGGLHLGRDESLAAVASAIGSAAGAGQAELHIFAPEGDKARANSVAAVGAHVRFMGSVDAHKVPEVLRDADVLVHVESFNREVAQFTRLSVSTKIPQYLSATRPIVAFGPADLASIKYVAWSGGGLVASNPTELRQAVQTLMLDIETRVRLGSAGWQQAQAQHQSTSVRRRFRAVLNTVAMEGRSHVTP